MRAEARSSNMTGRREPIDVPEVPMMIMIDNLYVKQMGIDICGNGCCAHARAQRLAKLQLCMLGERDL